MTHRCNLCSGTRVTSLIEFGAHPIAHHLLRDPVEPEYTHPVNLGYCRSCGLTQLIDPVSPEKFYTDYNWLSSWKWNPYAPNLVDAIARMPGLNKDSLLIEVGCNDGSFLSGLRQIGFERLLGVEPAQDAASAAQLRGLETIHAYFTPAVARQIVASFGQCELLISRQVLEHVQNLQEFSEAMRLVLRPGACVLVEVPDFDFIQDAPDYSAIWEEHVNQFTADTLTNFLAAAGVQVTRLETANFCGRALVASGCYTGQRSGVVPVPSTHSYEKALAFCDRWPRFRSAIDSYLSMEARAGRRIALYGAGCRACCLVNYAGLRAHLAFAVDDQQEKQGRFMPGSRLSIRPSDALFQNGVNLCLLAVNAENEEKVIARQTEFIRHGGRFVSVHPPSPRLPDFWRQI